MTNVNSTGTTVLEHLRTLDTATLFESGARATMGPEIRMLSGECRLVHCFIDFRSRFYAIGSILVGPFDWPSGFVV